MEYIKRYEADSGKNGDWFVFDNEVFHCMAGPMSEEKAIDMAISLNRSNDIQQLNQFR